MSRNSNQGSRYRRCQRSCTSLNNWASTRACYCHHVELAEGATLGRMAAKTRSIGRPPARVAKGIGARIRGARNAAGWTQAELAGERFSKAYISALENGLVQPSMAALAYLAERLGTSSAALVASDDHAWTPTSAWRPAIGRPRPMPSRSC